MVDKSIQNKKLVVRALFCMVTAGNGRGWLRPSLAASFLVAAKPKERRDMSADVERTYKKEAKDNLLSIITILTIIVIIPLAYLFYQQRNERIDCHSLTKSSLRYLEDAGEELPAACFAP